MVGDALSLLVGTPEGATPLEDRWFLTNLGGAVLTTHLNGTPRCLPYSSKNLCLHKNLHIHVCGSFIRNCQEREFLKHFSVGEQINKRWSTHEMEYDSVTKGIEPTSGGRHEKTRNVYC